ncbi:MAG: CBS domain-containing protein [Planctomycetales bacterium]|nr:CBS domain-containing protein [Planctomycetales bacterium]
MKNAIERIRNLRVADVMSREPVTVSANATMAEAAKVLCGEQIGGAPVVDEMGHCVGVLSSRDFAARDQKDTSGLSHSGLCDDFAVISSDRSGPMHIERFPEGSVRRYMQSTVQTVSDQTPLIDAATIMSNQHIHRLIVLDETSHPVGIVTSIDLLKAIVHELKH